MTTSGLRTCPHCQRPWPKTADHDLRSFRWLDPLPRKISLSNADLLIHDGLHNRDRFLFVEAKMPWEPALQKGQGWLLRALASQANWTVRILHGRLGDMSLYRVGPNGVEASGWTVSAADFRASVVDWLNGQPWADPHGKRLPTLESGHTHGWAFDDNDWRCVQDYYAVGRAPETGCGAIYEIPA